jgi:hypothetical protein
MSSRPGMPEVIREDSSLLVCTNSASRSGKALA